jgi:hypothetical protein
VAKQEELAKEITNFASRIISKILHVADGFTSQLKEGVLVYLSTLKIHCPRPGLKSITLGAMASMLTTKPPRMT